MLSQVAQFEVVGDQMTGPLIYGFSVDAVAAAKVVADFAKTNDKLVIRGGAFAGKALDVNGVKQLANIPSKEVLLAQLCGLLMSPISRTAVVLGALAAKKGGGAEATAEAARRSSCRLNARSFQPNLFRKSKWHSIKTHF